MVEDLDDWVLLTEKAVDKATPLESTAIDELINTEAEKVFKHSAINAISESVPAFSICEAYEVPDPSVNTECLFSGLLSCSDINPEIRSKINSDTGAVEGYVELWDEQLEGAGDSRTSLSLHRAVDAKVAENFFGSSSNFPFTPGT
uniref:Ski2_N domain-containing protein n=1 Tax=Syphacia muris TaxID=451379 RepID=A0A0N5ANE0_9BILA